MNSTGGGRKRKASGRRRRPAGDETAGEGGPDDALVLIAAAAAELAKLARRHKFEVLERLFAMARLEADEQQRSRSRRKLS
ncbi:hypothetical protein [Bradyrhizobium elkanii]|uniref:Uncharacterized protein n=1 Tax=Bradyrhizobium elkanii TaxID=29448 RepID=A0ABV4F3C0_BRAEL|nr:hypothetical protein [Bradyrhizobium elkanii]MCP1749345.1 hypothetical protein [Bradyrhizobium elkanii]MCP1983917.1 hypothetical protein [Bradyrhizobium elkanii]MCS3890360.1 hypothetical protein [Bradyrhizobium elkanii]MCS4220041.1 hypothetical protein [Bradyrhizobium elkanii]MCW2193747.1 hypothetical protein [Bradyrhizobium elkanii]